MSKPKTRPGDLFIGFQKLPLTSLALEADPDASARAVADFFRHREGFTGGDPWTVPLEVQGCRILAMSINLAKVAQLPRERPEDTEVLGGRTEAIEVLTWTVALEGLRQLRAKIREIGVSYAEEDVAKTLIAEVLRRDLQVGRVEDATVESMNNRKGPWIPTFNLVPPRGLGTSLIIDFCDWARETEHSRRRILRCPLTDECDNLYLDRDGCKACRSEHTKKTWEKAEGRIG